MYKMYLIKEYSFKIIVACEKCVEKGYIDKNCYACNGKGLHNKTLEIWKVRERLYNIDKIDRDSNSELRYWEDMSCFFEEKSKLIHFNVSDAQKECDKRNIDKYGKEFFLQYLK